MKVREGILSITIILTQYAMKYYLAIVTSVSSLSDSSSKVVPTGIFPSANSLATFDMHTAPTAAMVDRCSVLAM